MIESKLLLCDVLSEHRGDGSWKWISVTLCTVTNQLFEARILIYCIYNVLTIFLIRFMLFLFKKVIDKNCPTHY